MVSCFFMLKSGGGNANGVFFAWEGLADDDRAGGVCFSEGFHDGVEVLVGHAEEEAAGGLGVGEDEFLCVADFVREGGVRCSVGEIFMAATGNASCVDEVEYLG